MQVLVHQTQVLKFIEPHATCYVDVWSLKSMMSEEEIEVTSYNQIFFVKYIDCLSNFFLLSEETQLFAGCINNYCNFLQLFILPHNIL